MRIKLDGHELMFGDVLLTKPRDNGPFVVPYAGGVEYTVAKLRHPSG